MYIKLDHDLVPGKIKDLNKKVTLKGQKRKQEADRPFKASTLNVHKYEIKKGKMEDFFQKIDKNIPKTAQDKFLKQMVAEKGEKDANSKKQCNTTVVAGTKIKDLYFDHDFGFFSAILACYNNHWVLKTSPDDWWNCIVRNVAQHIDEHGDKNKVRDFFVDHEGKKSIEIELPEKIDLIDYSWLFDQFSKGIRENIKVPEYVDAMEPNFSTTTSNQLISSQIMIMSSMQKYFDFGMMTSCGIPGVDMQGSLEDWQNLVTKTENLQKLLSPIMDEMEVELTLSLRPWFDKVIEILRKLVDTFEGNPDVEWWSHILSWNKTYGSGARKWWSGWIIDFLNGGQAEKPRDFQSGVVSVPLKIKDENFGPPVEDIGTLIAGTVGFTIEKGPQAPIVEAKQGWALLLPKGSPVISRMAGLNYKHQLEFTTHLQTVFSNINSD